MRRGPGAVWVVLLGALCALEAQDAGSGIWDDPEFKKAFLGTYGIHADVEPGVSTEERALLEKIYPILSSDPDEAARQIEAGRKPDSTALFDFILGNIAFQQDRLDDAGRYYHAAVTRLPSFRRAFKNLGLVQVRRQRLDEAITSFTRMIQLGGGDSLSYGLLGYAYAAKLDFLAAEAAYRNALLLDPESTEYRIGLVRAVVKQQKFEEAAGLLGVLIERQPDRAEFWLLQANAFIGMKQPLEAAENLEVVWRMGQGTADAMNLLGDIYVNEELPNLAATAYARSLEAGPDQDLARPLRNAEVLLTRGAVDEAAGLVGAIRRTAGERLTGDERKHALELEARIAMAQGSGDDAARILEELVAQDPLDGDALLLLAQHYAKDGDAQRALLYYERAGNLEAFEAQAKVRQGQLLVGLGKYPEALQLLRRSQEIAPSEQVARYIEQVERASRAQR